MTRLAGGRVAADPLRTGAQMTTGANVVEEDFVCVTVFSWGEFVEQSDRERRREGRAHT